jgi:hypothetical protein
LPVNLGSYSKVWFNTLEQSSKLDPQFRIIIDFKKNHRGHRVHRGENKGKGGKERHYSSFSVVS